MLVGGGDSRSTRAYTPDGGINPLMNLIPSPSRRGHCQDQGSTHPHRQLLRGTDAAKPPTYEDAHPVAQPLRLLHRVRSQQDSPCLVRILDGLPQEPARCWVEPRRWFIEVADNRRTNEGDCDREAALHATAEAFYCAVDLVEKVDRGECFVDLQRAPRGIRNTSSKFS
jgi:hypothetical protein